MHLRPQAIAGLTIQQIEETDSLLAIATWKADSLSGLFMTVSDKDLIEPYQVAKASTGDLFSRNSIEARLTQTGEFYIISSLNGVSIKHTSVSISSANAEAKTDIVPYDNALNYRSNGSEMITFTASKCDTLGRFAVTHDNNKLTLTFHGNSDYRVSLSATDVHKLADTYRMADAISRKATLSKQLELLRAKLQVARDQDARTSTVDTPDK
jgi:hypothetical protein